MALALTLTAISPAVGGVLVRGEKGTAKSTMVRALASVLPPIEVVAGDRFSSDPADPHPLSPDGPFAAGVATETRAVRLVELPVGATEDRVLGSLHLEKALSEGVTSYEPGLLALAHRGILYVDEVNLLHDHLVDLLLDAAAMGRSTVERDGVSVEHAAQFVLVGTMNPEEGELRPQLLDRFGLTVEARAPRDPAVRAEIVRRRMAYDSDPDGFASRFAEDEAELTDRIQAAQKLVAQIELDDAALTTIAEICAAFDVDGMRADIVTARAAAAHAAWEGRTSVNRDDIRVAARLALPHRRRRNPFDAPGLDEDLLDQLLGHDEPEPDPPTGTDGPVASGAPTGVPREREVPPAEGPEATAPDDASDASHPPAPPSGGASERVTSAADPYRAKLFTVSGLGSGEAGRRSRAITSTGRRIGATRGTTGAIHLTETVRSASVHQYSRGRRSGRLLFEASDLRIAVKEGRESNLVLFCVDASGSMAARRRMEQVKAAILSLLLDAYQRRDKVGLVTFRGSEAVVTLPPTSSIDAAAKRLEELPAGGRTPLAEGLLTATETLRLEHIRDPRRRPLLVVVTDGRATSGPDAVARAHVVAAHLADTGVASLVVDCEDGPMRLGLGAVLAERLHGEHVLLAEVTADALVDVARTRMVA
jgi:magnesium chelatase subunit D